jgi:hypothetical protein
MSKSTAKNHIFRRVGTIATCAALGAAWTVAPPPAAHADDASLKQTILNWMPRINADSDMVNTALSGKITRGKLRRGERLIRHLDTDIATLLGAIEHDQASSPDGVTGRQAALETLSLTLQGNRAIIRALRAAERGKPKLARHDFVVADTFYREARQPGNEADKALGLPPHTLGY